MDRRFTQIHETFAAEDLQQMRMARRYQRWVFSLLEPHVGTRVLELGCGVGTITAKLLERADFVCGMEPNEACRGALADAVRAHPRFQLKPWAIEQCDVGWLLGRRFDTAVCVNVLEHIADDAHALRLLGALVAEQAGRVVVFVPAVPAAYGPLDAALGHHRRYTRRGLIETIERAGLTPRLVRYSNVIGLLAWLFNARVSGLDRHSDRQIQIFESLVAPWVPSVERIVRPPIGLSLVAVADGGPAARVPIAVIPTEAVSVAGC